MLGKFGLVAPPGAVRLLLALLVVVAHLSRFEVGRLAVLLFFVLSGYWVTALWETRFGRGRLLDFYGSRYFRIMPLYAICVSIFAIILKQNVGIVNFILFGVASQSVDPLGVSWSLDVEIQFYALVPLLAWMVRGSKPGVLAICFSIATVVGWYLGLKFDVWTVAAYLPAFIIGVLGAIFKYRPSYNVGVASLAAFLVTTVLLLCFPWTLALLDAHVENPINKDVFAFLWMLPVIPYIFASIGTPSGRMDRHLGNVSYPLYLVHYPIIYILREEMGASPQIKLLSIAVAIGVALALYLLVDRRIDPVRLQIFEARPAREKSARG